MENLVPVLLSGGVGTRLWPASRELYPKQLVDIAGAGSLLQQAARRAVEAAAPERVVTVTTDAHSSAVLDELGEVSSGLMTHVLVEPVGRNTAAAVALAALYARDAFAEAVLWVAPTDHVMTRPEALLPALSQAADAALEGRLVTFGVAPDGPDSGFGYIRSGPALPGRENVFTVESYVEKPDERAAKRLVRAGGCYWNSGMFVFTAATILDELGRTAPEILDGVRRAYDAAAAEKRPLRLPPETYREIPALPVDKAVMERSSSLAVVPVDLGWSDIGSWERLWQVFEKDTHGNVAEGDVLLEKSRNSLVRADHRLVACSGVSDVVVVETADAVLVADKGDAEGVRAIVERLKASGRSEATNHLSERRPWGSFTVLLEGSRFKIKEITVKPGGALSLQMHRHRSEHWVVIEGTAKVTRGDEVQILKENQSTYIPARVKHRLENPGEEPLRIVEVQSGTYVGEDDIVRFDDAYGRTG